MVFIKNTIKNPPKRCLCLSLCVKAFELSFLHLACSFCCNQILHHYFNKAEYITSSVLISHLIEYGNQKQNLYKASCIHFSWLFSNWIGLISNWFHFETKFKQALVECFTYVIEIMAIVIHFKKKKRDSILNFFAKFGRKEFFIKLFPCICILLRFRVNLGVFNFAADFALSDFWKH